MEFIQSIQGIIAVSILTILDLFAVAKAVMVIVTKVKSLQGASEEERQIAKESVVENLQQIIFGLVTDAEKELGAGTGKLKSAKVAGWIYDKIPDELKPLFTAKEIQVMIDAALQDAQEYWDKNSKARKYIDSGNPALLTAEIEATSPTAGVGVDEFFKAVSDRIGEAIVKASETPRGDEMESPTHAQKIAAAAQNEAPAGKETP